MAGGVKGRRGYRSPLREQQARATQRAILGAARELFTGRGYPATSIQAIAQRAGVSAATIYATFGTKRAVLGALVDVSIAGDDDPVPILDRPWVRDLREEPDLLRRVRILAHEGRRILERRFAIDAVMAAAAPSDAEIAELWSRTREQRHAGQRRLLELVIGTDGRVRDGLTVDVAADIMYAIGSPETYRLLVEDRGWSAQRFEEWYADAMERLLLER